MPHHHTKPGADDPAFTALWKAHQPRMLDLAFRILLDVGDAEDAVQEAFTRLARTDVAGIDDPEGWLVVVTTRLCLDRLRTRRRRPTDALDVAGDPFDPRALEPSSQVTLVDRVTLAMHALLERLSPAERISFVLHDVFARPLDDRQRSCRPRRRTGGSGPARRGERSDRTALTSIGSGTPVSLTTSDLSGNADLGSAGPVSG